MNVSLFIGNLSFDINHDNLMTILKKHGKILSLEISEDKFTFKSKGFARALVQDQQTADCIIQELNGENINGRTIKIEMFHE